MEHIGYTSSGRRSSRCHSCWSLSASEDFDKPIHACMSEQQHHYLTSLLNLHLNLRSMLFQLMLVCSICSCRTVHSLLLSSCIRWLQNVCQLTCLKIYLSCYSNGPRLTHCWDVGHLQETVKLHRTMLSEEDKSKLSTIQDQIHILHYQLSDLLLKLQANKGQIGEACTHHPSMSVSSLNHKSQI